MYLVVGLFLVSSLSKLTYPNNKQHKIEMGDGEGIYMNLGVLNSSKVPVPRNGRRKISLQRFQNDVGGMDRNTDNVLAISNVMRTIAHASRNDRNRLSLDQITAAVRRMDRNKNNVIDIPDEFVSNIPSNRTQ